MLARSDPYHMRDTLAPPPLRMTPSPSHREASYHRPHHYDGYHNQHHRPHHRQNQHPYEPYALPRLYPSLRPHHSPTPSPPPITRRPEPASSNLYQPSRGAQRDAKYYARHREKQHLQTLTRDPTKERGMEWLRSEQVAAVDHARRNHLQRKNEEEKRVRRIQLQVFVHARPTACLWKGCHAVLNSWALLEKHLHHAHLRSGCERLGHVKREQGACAWDGCPLVTKDDQACYKHCLVTHMGEYSGRCPFNCLFDSPHFPELMAHIARRHPIATPDDFLPGLIHHRPLHIPTLAELPPLPHPLVIPSRRQIMRVRPWIGEISQRTKKLVNRGCISGKRPRKEDFADKKGASAAIRATIENCQRLRESEQDDSALTSDVDMVVPPSALSCPKTARSEVQLVNVDDVCQSAKKETLLDTSLFVTTSSGGEEKVISPSGKWVNSRSTDISSTSSSSSSSPTEGSFSDFDGKKIEKKLKVEPAEMVNTAEETVKRSERLRMKMTRRMGDASLTRV